MGRVPARRVQRLKDTGKVGKVSEQYIARSRTARERRCPDIGEMKGISEHYRQGWESLRAIHRKQQDREGSSLPRYSRDERYLRTLLARLGKAPLMPPLQILLVVVAVVVVVVVVVNRVRK